MYHGYFVHNIYNNVMNWKPHSSAYKMWNECHKENFPTCQVWALWKDNDDLPVCMVKMITAEVRIQEASLPVRDSFSTVPVLLKLVRVPTMQIEVSLSSDPLPREQWNSVGAAQVICSELQLVSNTASHIFSDSSWMKSANAGIVMNDVLFIVRSAPMITDQWSLCYIKLLLVRQCFCHMSARWTNVLDQMHCGTIIPCNTQRQLVCA